VEKVERGERVEKAERVEREWNEHIKLFSPS